MGVEAELGNDDKVEQAQARALSYPREIEFADRGDVNDTEGEESVVDEEVSHSVVEVHLNADYIACPKCIALLTHLLARDHPIAADVDANLAQGILLQLAVQHEADPYNSVKIKLVDTPRRRYDLVKGDVVQEHPCIFVLEPRDSVPAQSDYVCVPCGKRCSHLSRYNYSRRGL